ncbi:D-alanyl-D-alanine carboxypeptidase family protein [Cellulomonas sp. GbtcB1]|uniref:M15 family metallopeptidase n=1 Tax=Cellulomonas sp. GbtcB1 TaxID=2824746 RepID=UPI001C2FCA44|nr:M15 family metallopeptidase [Cellulomonas sp. GbtcB1]
MPSAPRRPRHRMAGRARLGRGAAVARVGGRSLLGAGLAVALGVTLTGTPALGGTGAPPAPAAAKAEDATGRGFDPVRTAAADGDRWVARTAAEEPAVTAASALLARAALDAAAGVEPLRVSPQPLDDLPGMDAAVVRLTDAWAEPAATAGDRVASALRVRAAAGSVFRLALAVERSVPVAADRAAGDVAGLDRVEQAAGEATRAAADLPVLDGRVVGAPVRTGGGSARPSGLLADGTVDPVLLCPVPFAPGARLRCDAVVALTALNEEFRAEHGTDLPVGSTYRTYAEQAALKAAKGGLAAPAGVSHHGWGVAVDFAGFGGVGQFDQPLYAWMVEHGPAHGWEHPAWAGPGGAGPAEPWHWEYTGTPAPAAAGAAGAAPAGPAAADS